MAGGSVYQYINMQERPAPGSTKVWMVNNNHSGGAIGSVRWYGAWRQYCFFPADMTVFSAGCMRDVADFIGKQMAAWRESRAAGKRGRDEH